MPGAQEENVNCIKYGEEHRNMFFKEPPLARSISSEKPKGYASTYAGAVVGAALALLFSALFLEYGDYFIYWGSILAKRHMSVGLYAHLANQVFAGLAYLLVLLVVIGGSVALGCYLYLRVAHVASAGRTALALLVFSSSSAFATALLRMHGLIGLGLALCCLAPAISRWVDINLPDGADP